jgi:hypothetical protein
MMDAGLMAIERAAVAHARLLNDDGTPDELALDKLRSALSAGRYTLTEPISPSQERLGARGNSGDVEVVKIGVHMAAKVLGTSPSRVISLLRPFALQDGDGKWAPTRPIGGVRLRCVMIPVDVFGLEADPVSNG